MRTLIQWSAVTFILASSSAVVLSSPDVARSVPTTDAVELSRAHVGVPFASPPAAPVEVAAPVSGPRESWCEPADPLGCLQGSECPPMADGTQRVCIQPWYRERPDQFLCAVRMPPRDVQRWRERRLRVLVDEICKPRDGCKPAALHNYLTALVRRETSLRPYKRGRLNPDVEASTAAWSRRASTFADSPAAGYPERWTAVGYYQQNAALWLDRWDASSIPEALCGEVESTLTHLRGARDRWRRLEHGVSCEGAEHHGTAAGEGGAPSWYDISLVNSGSEACPGTAGKPAKVRASFERRLKRRGADAYAPVSLAMLGRPVPREEQTAFAARVREKMEAVAR